MTKESLPVIDKWYEFLNWLLDRTQKFPKSVRFTITTRIDNAALSILEKMISARYDKQNRQTILANININLEQLRFLLRLAYDRKYLPAKSYGFAMTQLVEIGKQIGGWQKSCGDS